MLLLRTHRLSQLRSSAAARNDTHVGIAPDALRMVSGLRATLGGMEFTVIGVGDLLLGRWPQSRELA